MKRGMNFNFKDLFTRWYFILIIIFLVFILIFVAVSQFHIQNYILKGGFDVGGKAFIKLNIPEGGQSSETITINNNGRADDFTISFSGLNNLVSMKENSFYIGSKKSKQVNIDFNGDSDSKINTGWVIIESSSSTQKIPVVLGIEDKNPVFAVTQTPIPNYMNAFPNGKFGVDVKFSNLKDNDIHNVQATYTIRDFENNIYFSETEYLTIKDSLSVAKIIDLPEGVGKGNYIFITTLMSDGLSSFSNYVFEVKGKEFNINFDILQNYLVIFILIAIVAVLFYFIYFIRNRSEMYQLSRQQKREMKRNLVLIKKYREQMKRGLKAELIDEEKRILEERLKLKKERETREMEEIREKIKQEKRKNSVLWKIVRYVGNGINSYLEKRKREKLKEKREKEKERARKLSVIKRFFRKTGETLFDFFRQTGRKTEKITLKAAKEQKKLEEKKEKLTKEGQKEVASEFKKKKNKLIGLFEEKLKQIDQKKEQIVEELKEKHEEQKEQVKELKKEEKTNEIAKRLIIWEKEAEQMPVAKKFLNLKEEKIQKILKQEEKDVKKEFMDKFYSDLRSRRFKLE